MGLLRQPGVPFPIQRALQLRGDREVGVKPRALYQAHTERQSPFVLEPAERTLDRAAATVETLPTWRPAWDQRFQSGCFDLGAMLAPYEAHANYTLTAEWRSGADEPKF